MFGDSLSVLSRVYNTRMIQGVIFDMDGLMLDTEPAYRVAWQQAAAECGFDLLDALYFTLVGRSRIEGEQALVAAFGPGFPLDAFHDACLRHEAAVFDVPPRRRWKKTRDGCTFGFARLPASGQGGCHLDSAPDCGDPTPSGRTAESFRRRDQRR